MPASKVAKPASDLSFLLPSLFVARPVFPARPTVDAWAFAAVSGLRQGLSARLTSVAAETVPRSRKGPRRKAAQSAQKAIPKKAPRVLKRYKQEALPSAAAALRRPVISHPTSRVGNIVSLNAGLRRMPRELPVLASERLAA
ncbi:hypothetical protein [Hyphomicrobium sp. LHD-15]|uniref:hypothetical protein n=1 Tax=Hyphomicrobium sp. LHD-15 TaxID=3072142 RepID=UPI00280DC6FF|nr:hypothetical protein [Hyphomicrobium sp. LHD-15]MDQ8699443.1 hypothetical protein [Hyphomicrobium sp. LHD-15]